MFWPLEVDCQFTVPADTAGNALSINNDIAYTLIVLGFQQKPDAHLKTWAKPVKPNL